eukprot:gene2970-14881_t
MPLVDAEDADTSSAPGEHPTPDPSPYSGEVAVRYSHYTNYAREADAASDSAAAATASPASVGSAAATPTPTTPTTQIVTEKANKAAQVAAKQATNLGDAIKIPKIPPGTGALRAVVTSAAIPKVNAVRWGLEQVF